MRLKVQHETVFQYDRPIYETAMEVRLCPCNDPSQDTLSFRLRVEPRVRHYEYRDYFGITACNFTIPFNHQRIVVYAESVVETRPLTKADTVLPIENAQWDPFVYFDYLRPSRYIKSCALIEHAAAEFRPLLGQDMLGCIDAIAMYIRSSLQYEQGTTTVFTTSDQVMELKRGVCQDFTHVMIAICRELGIPARYVSGYVLGGTGNTPQASGTGASHAWCEVAVPGTGWVGYDPTLRRRVNEKYIKIGSGRDYADVTPIKGVYRGKVSEALRINVHVVAVEN